MINLKKTFFMRGFLLVSFIFFQSFALYASQPPTGCYCACCNPPSVRIAYGGQAKPSIHLKTLDVSTLNLKKDFQKSIQQTNAAISITLDDFNNISAVGNSWLFYQTKEESFSMDIGTANNASPQTWALPSNFLTHFQGAGKSDFIAPSSVPVALQIAGANKVMKTAYYDSNERLMDVFDHYALNASNIDHIGTSYDMEIGSDDVFNEPDYELTDVPLDLNDTYTTINESEDYLTNLTLVKYESTVNVDAYGTISTPNGTFECLRMSIVVQRFTRPDESSAYTLVETTNEISFLTKEGYYFNARVSATSGTVNCTNLVYRSVVQSSLLTETGDVKVNNNSKGVTINTDNDEPHESAILDINSNNKGILIPRVTQANRPTNPADGLIIYQIDGTKGLYVYIGGIGWKRLATD